MPVSPMDKTWYTDLSLNLATLADCSTTTLAAKSILWGWKAVLMGQIGSNVQGLWTCVGSSAGGGSFNMAGTDSWGSTFTAANLVRASAGSNHSWFALKSPSNLGGTGIFHYLILDWSTASDPTVTVTVGKTAPSGGSATAAPTITGSWVHSSVTFFDNTATAHRIHRCTTTTGENHVCLSKSTTQKWVTAFSIIDLTQESRASDTSRVVSYIDHNVTNGPYEPASGNMLVSGQMKGNYYNNTTNTTVGFLGLTEATSFSSPNTVQTTANPYDGLVDDYPLYVAYTQASFRGKKGRVSDVFPAFKPTTLPTVYPSTGTPTHHLVGSCWLPLGGGTATL